MNKINWILFGIIFLFFSIHLSYLNTPFVNHEIHYSKGSQYFLTQNPGLLNEYFRWQANPLTYSYISSIFVRIFGDNYASYRILSLLGGVLLLITLFKYKSWILILIVGLNPLIWIYSGRAHSELISVGLVFLALNNNNFIVNGILSGISGCLKYHAILVSSGFWAFGWIRDQIMKWEIDLKNKNFLSGLISVLILFIFLLIYRELFGVWIIPEYFSGGFFKIGVVNCLNNFFSYGFYLSGIFFLTIPFLIQTLNLKWKIFYLFVSVLLSIITSVQGSEMAFGGFFNQVLNEHLILLIKIVGFWNFLSSVHFFWNKIESHKMLFTVVFVIIILSFMRPAQRYLIFVIPFWAVLIHQHMNIFRSYKIGYIFILVILNLFSVSYQLSTAFASKNIAEWAIHNNFFINSGAIHAHVGNFSHHKDDSNLIVLDTSWEGTKINRDVLYKAPVKIFGYPIKQYNVARIK